MSTKPAGPLNDGIHYKNKGGKGGILLSEIAYQTKVYGHSVSFDRDSIHCDLFVDGTLLVYPNTEWDYGTFAIDTPAMVYASLEHDVLCKLTNYRLIPWKYRFIADKGLWSTLGSQGAKVSRLWRTPAVMIYSQFVGRWKDKKAIT
jgi:hypothetical protein